MENKIKTTMKIYFNKNNEVLINSIFIKIKLELFSTLCFLSFMPFIYLTEDRDSTASRSAINQLCFKKNVMPSFRFNLMFNFTFNILRLSFYFQVCIKLYAQVTFDFMFELCSSYIQFYVQFQF